MRDDKRDIVRVVILEKIENLTQYRFNVHTKRCSFIVIVTGWKEGGIKVRSCIGSWHVITKRRSYISQLMSREW